MLVWCCSGTCIFAACQFFNDATLGMGNAVGMVINIDPDSAYHSWAFISSVCKTNYRLIGYPFQNGKFYYHYDYIAKIKTLVCKTYKRFIIFSSLLAFKTKLQTYRWMVWKWASGTNATRCFQHQRFSNVGIQKRKNHKPKWKYHWSIAFQSVIAWMYSWDSWKST